MKTIRLSIVSILTALPLLTSCAVLAPLAALVTPAVEEEAVEEAGTLAVDGVEALEKYEVKKIEAK